MQIKYGKKTEEQTPHLIGPKGDLLVVAPEVAPYMFPLVTIDLSECADQMKGRLMFVYAEFAESTPDGRAEGLAFRVDEEGRYTLDERSTTEFKRFIDEVTLPTAPPPEEWKAEYLELLETQLESDAFDDLWDLRAEIKKISKDQGWDDNYPIFGAQPLWMQPSVSAPLDPDGEPMMFIGQMNAAFVTDYAGPFELMLFYSPKHRLVMQYGQCS